MAVLLSAGPFDTLDATSDAFGLPPTKGVVASNVDVSASPGVLTTALGRSVDFTFPIPAGYTLVALAALPAFYGEPATAITQYVYCITSGGAPPISEFEFEVGTVSPTTGIRVPYGAAKYFTQAVRFGNALWTNGGDKWIYGASYSTGGTYGTIGALIRDDWQIQVPFQYSYNLVGTYANGGTLPPDTYTYAITLRRSANFSAVPNGAGKSVYSFDLDTFQESSPVFTTSVTTTTGQYPGFTSAVNSGPHQIFLTPLISGTTAGGEQYFGCLYRSRTGDPTYQFVDYLSNVNFTVDYAGNPAFIDSATDAQLASGGDLIIHNDPPPLVGQVYPGPVVTNANAESAPQSTAQAAFFYQNPGFITKHKSRMWVFTLYPSSPQGIVPPSTSVALQPQLWYSNEGQPWSFNDDTGVLPVGPEDTPGNVDYSSSFGSPWAPNVVTDTPTGLATTGSVLVVFRLGSTWVVYGDTPAEFIIRRAFDIGCMATNSITEAEGGVFFLAPQGVYFFDGAAPTYIGEPIRKAIEALPWATRQAAVGSYRDRTFYFSVGGATYAYYTPAQRWYTLPYAPQIALYDTGNQNQLLFCNVANAQVVAANVNAATSDLGAPITATWTTGITDSKMPGMLKTFGKIIVETPYQVGTVTAALTTDPGYPQAQTFSWTWNTAVAVGALVADLPPRMTGYTAQLTITATAPAGSPPVVVRSVTVMGEPESQAFSTAKLDGSGALNGVLNG